MGERPEEERERLRPRFGRRVRERTEGSPVASFLIRRGHGPRRYGPGWQRAPPPPYPHRADARRCLVKAHVHRMTARWGPRAAARHLRYIERDGVEKDGSPGVLYGPDGPLEREDFGAPREGERHQFRFIVSPEDGGALELTEYTRRLMGRVEKDLGRSIEWAAANHYDTGHPHAHVVVRGVDLEGHELRISRTYISQGMRGTAQELATDLLGPRRPWEIERTRRKELTQERFTSLDRGIERAATGDGRVELAALYGSGARDANLLVGRLERLEAMRLAERTSPSSWVLAPGWQASLRQWGERGDILKRIHRAMQRDSAQPHIVEPGQALPDARDGAGDAQAVVGRVAGMGLADESKGVYAVVETPAGQAYYVRLSEREADRVQTGDLVSVTTRRVSAVRPVDRHLVEVARAQGGVYAFSPEAGSEDAARSAPARLRELGRLGLATERAPGRWSVPADLLTQLEEHAPARHRLSIEPQPLSLDAQVHHRGPTWLDSLDPKTLAPAGFGAEVGQVLARRAETLRSLGIAPDDPAREAKLGELERARLSLAARGVRELGRAFVDPVPEGFRGRAVQGNDRSPYLIVDDGKRFVILTATAEETRAWKGKVVELSGSAQGPVRITAVPELAQRKAPERTLPERSPERTPPGRGRGGPSR